MADHLPAAAQAHAQLLKDAGGHARQLDRCAHPTPLTPSSSASPSTSTPLLFAADTPDECEQPRDVTALLLPILGLFVALCVYSKSKYAPPLPPHLWLRHPRQRLMPLAG